MISDSSVSPSISILHIYIYKGREEKVTMDNEWMGRGERKHKQQWDIKKHTLSIKRKMKLLSRENII